MVNEEALPGWKFHHTQIRAQCNPNIHNVLLSSICQHVQNNILCVNKVLVGWC